MKHYRILVLGISLFLSIFISCAQQKEKSPSNHQKQKTKYNRLINASSPYLQEHADNPVDWYEWGPEALQKAKKENKLLIISIGYAACHWCHVMERETYMDSSAAKIMNDNFVSIKIDREERPDLDQVYMSAAQLLNGSGGWPLNVVALPNGKPFFAGTYFSNAQWKDVLTKITKVYKNNPEKIEAAATALTKGIREQDVVKMASTATTPLSKESYIGLFSNWQKIVDFKKGGFNSAPKFPLPVGWQFLLQYHYLTGNPKALQAVETTLDNMAKGGIYDQLGGGFSRYSTDNNWFAPHFEKMLYDNAQLVSLYSSAYKVTKKEEYKNVVEKTLKFINNELAAPNGGYYSSLNADSEGEEGKFYVWRLKEIENALSPTQARLVEDFYQIKNNGNWEKGQNILHKKYSEKQYAKTKNLKLSDLKKELREAQNKLLEVRNKRIHPSTDDKVLTSWNALMITAYLDAYTALGDDKYLQKALENARFIENNMEKTNGGLWRNYKDGKASINAFLDDYAFLAQAYFQLYEVTFDKKWLEKSKSLTDYAIAHFQDKKSGFFFYTSNLGEDLIARKKEITDNVMPSSNSVMATMLYKLGSYFENRDYLTESEKMVGQVQENIKDGGPYYANWAMLMGTMSFSPFEIAIMGENSFQKNRELQKNYLPTSFFMGGTTEDLPLLKEKLVKGETIIYVCKNKTCKLPVYETKKALQLTQEYQNKNTGTSWQY